MKEGLAFAARKGFHNVQVEGDSKLVIHAVLGHWDVPWNLLTVVKEIRELAKKFFAIKWNHIFREVNFVEDAFAKHGSRILSNHIWESVTPQFTSYALNFDCIDTGI